jgi:hypothetical protein
MKLIRIVLLLFSFYLLGCHSTKSSITASKNWLGVWNRNEHQNEAVLQIDSLRNDSVYFHINASNGGHTGDVEGWAVVKGNDASYLEVLEKDTCSITLTLCADSVILVKQHKGDCFAAMGVYYDGAYLNNKLTSKDNETDYVEHFKILEDSIANKALKTLVGKDWDLFVNSTQLSSPDTLDIDSLHATVHASGVRGLFTEMENIIMVDCSNTIWAAVIDDRKVYYYTTRKDWADRFPKTFSQWMENFKEYPISFKSK